jgi:LysR family cyn operon transcriptional activator
MTFRQFLIFTVAAKHRNVTKAAQELHTSQPSISRQLKLLQETYRIQLYERLGRGIRLTDAGQVFLRDADAILKQLSKLEAKLKGLNSGPAQFPTLTVGAGRNVSVYMLPSLSIQFRKIHPDTKLDLRSGNKETLHRLLSKREVEIALVTNPKRPRGVVVEPLYRRELTALVCVKSPLARKRELSASDLIRFPLMIRGSREGNKANTFLHHMAKHRLTADIFMHCDSADTLRAAVRETNGIGLLYKEVRKDPMINGEFRTVRLNGLRLEAKVAIVYRKDKPLSLPARDFVALLRQWRDNNHSFC